MEGRQLVAKCPTWRMRDFKVFLSYKSFRDVQMADKFANKLLF